MAHTKGSWVTIKTPTPNSAATLRSSPTTSSELLLVQRAGRLVAEDDAGLHHQCPGYRRALELAAGQRGRVVVRQRAEAELVEQLTCPLASIARLGSRHDERNGYVRGDGHVVEERGELKDEAACRAAGEGDVRLAEVPYVFACPFHATVPPSGCRRPARA